MKLYIKTTTEISDSSIDKVSRYFIIQMYTIDVRFDRILEKEIEVAAAANTSVGF
jgi:hypothetical protein